MGVEVAFAHEPVVRRGDRVSREAQVFRQGSAGRQGSTGRQGPPLDEPFQLEAQLLLQGALRRAVEDERVEEGHVHLDPFTA